MQGEHDLCFGPHRLDLGAKQLWRDQKEVKLTPKALAVLLVLVARAGQVVTKDELFQSVWLQTVVSDDALTTCILELRHALRDKAKQPRYIETVHRRGYRFIASLSAAPPVPSSESRSQNPEVSGQEKNKNTEQSEGIGLQAEGSSPSFPSNLQSEAFGFSQSSESRAGTARRKRAMVAVASLLLLAGAFVIVRYFFFPLVPHHSSLATEEAQPPAWPLPDKPSIVILPFVNLSGDPGQEYFNDGITEEITTALSRLSSLFVIARTSAFSYKGKGVKVQDISREMGVRYILEGSVRKADGQVRILAQLIDAATGEHVWAERYDRPLQNIFAVQDEIVQKIVTTLKLQLTLREQGVLARKATDNLEAHDYYLQGRDYRNRFTKEANAQARQLFERAITLDPMYAEAYAELGWTYYLEWSFQWSQDPQGLERALALGQKGITLDDSLARAHGLLGFIYARENQYDQALVEGERAIALDPNNADGYALQAGVLLFAGRSAEALQAIEQGMRLNPHYPAWYLQQLGNAYQQTGRYAEALAAHKQLLTRNPNFLWAYPNLAFSYLAQWGFQLSADPQTLERALEAAQRAVALNDTLPQAHAVLGYAYLMQKQYASASAEMERAIILDPKDANSYAFLAEALSRMGRSEEALWAAEQALRLKPLTLDGHLNSVGTAYYLAGRSEEAIEPLKQYLTRYPNHLGPHLALASVYSELGKEVEARAEAGEILRLNPQFSLEVHKERAPIKDPAMLERQIAALRKAGLK